MKKAASNIWKIAWPPLMYLGMQAVVSAVYSLIFMISAAFNLIFESVLTGEQTIENIDPGDLTETIISSINIYIPFIISVVAAFLTLVLIFRREWAAESFWSVKKIKVSAVLLCFALGVALNLFISGVLTFLSIPEETQSLDFMFGDNLPLMLFTIALLGPVLEEIIFRGVVQKRLTKMAGIYGAIIIQAVMFGVFHLNLLQGAYAFFLGLIIGTIYCFYSSIWIPIVLHIAFNGTSVIISHIAGDAAIDGFFLAAVTAVGFLISIGCMIELLRRKPPVAVKIKKNRWEV